MTPNDYYMGNDRTTKIYGFQPKVLARIIAWLQIFLNSLTALLIILTLVRVIDVPAQSKDADRIDGKEKTIFVFRVLICFVSIGMGVILLVGSTKDYTRRSYLSPYVIFGLVLFLWNVFIATFGTGHSILKFVQYAQLPVYAAGIAIAAILS